MKKMKWLTVFIGLVTATSAFAWQERGNGGDAVKVRGKYYSLDLYENGVEKQPSLKRSAVNENIKQELVAALGSERFPIQEIAAKLTEMHDQDPMFAWYIVRAMEKYTWVFVNGPLVNIEDEQDLVVDRSGGALVQAAIRSKAHIRISYPVWRKLDAANQAALVFHEMVYALTWPTLRKNYGPGEEFVSYQDSSIARRVIGFWFSPDFSSPSRGWKSFVILAPDVKRSLPHSGSTSRLFRFESPWPTDKGEARNRLVRPHFFAGEKHGLDFGVDGNGNLIVNAKELCDRGADSVVITDVRPRITEFFSVDPGGYEHEPFKGLPKEATYRLGWMDWSSEHTHTGTIPNFRRYENCEDFVNRFRPTKPFVN